jgi:transmembrane sensor
MENAPQKSLHEAAAAWHDRLHREKVADETRAQFGRWLAESPAHAAAYESIELAWSSLQRSAHDPQILALRHETALRLTRRSSRAIRPLGWAVAAALVLIVVGGAVAMLSEGSRAGRASVDSIVEALRTNTDGRYATATGERLTVTLDDGSQVTLNTNTELKVSFTPTDRIVRLVRGQALFEVAKDASRPFAVEAHDRRFVALGTAFDVRIDGERIKVTMLEGTVRVEHGTPRGVLNAGEQLTVDMRSEELVRATDPERVTSWRRGQVIFENTRLADAIAELNRYSETKIELADPALGDLRLSGAFATGRPTVFIEAITTYFPVQVERADPRAIVIEARQ